MTKAEERIILEKIVALIESTGPDSYIATAFQGCASDAELNITDDAAYSYYDRYNILKKKIASIKTMLMEILFDGEEQTKTDICGYEKTILDFCEDPADLRYLTAVSGRRNCLKKLGNIQNAIDIVDKI